MALSEVIVSFDLNQILGADYAPPGVSGYVKTNVLNGRLEDTSTGEIRIGDQAVTIATDGTGSWTTWAPGSDGNPISWQEWLVVSHRSVGNKTGRNTQMFGPYTITGTSKAVSNKALTSNVATITTTEAHGLDVGNTVTIAGVDATFNGTFTVTAVTSTTVSYAVVHANVASVAATGTLTSPNVKLTSMEEEQAVPAEYLTTVTEALQEFVDEGQVLLDAQLLISGLTGEDSAVAGLIDDELLGPLTRAALSATIDRAVVRPAIRPATALGSLTFDDGGIGFINDILPILDSLGVKGAVYPHSNLIGGTGKMTWANLAALDAAGHEVGAHTKSHPDVTTLTEAQQRTEIDLSALFATHDITISGMAWPYSASNASARAIAREVGMKYALGGTGGDTQPLWTYALKRVSFDDSTVQATAEGWIDDAIANDQYLVLMIHPDSTLTTGAARTRLSNVIAYGQAQGLPWVLPRDAFATIGNVVDIGDLPGGSTYTVIDGAGRLTASTQETLNAHSGIWNIKADGVTDDTVGIQAFLDYAKTVRRAAYFPAGDHLVSTLYVPMGIEIIGDGLGGYAATGAAAGTMIRQRAHVGAESLGPIFRVDSDDTSGANNFGPFRLANLVLRGSASNPTSRAFEFIESDGTTKTPIQDTVIFHNILIRGCRGGGIYMPKGARPLIFDTINLLFNGGYGIEIWGKDPSDGSAGAAYLTQAVHFSNISGDGNINGLIYLRKFDSGGAVTFTSIKSEKRINPPEGSVAGQADCLIFEDCDNTPIRLNGVSHTSSVPSGATFEPPGAAVVVKGTGKPWISGLTTVAVRVRSTDVAGSPAILRDDALSHTIAVTATGSDLREDFYGGSGTYKRSGRDLDESLASGESTLPRDRVFSSTALSTGVVRLSYFRAKKTESIGSIIVPGAGTAAGATPTLVRVGVYEENESSGDLTLVASCTSDTSKFSSATDGAESTFTLSAAFTKIRGKRYAVAELVVTAAAAPTVKTISGVSSAAMAKSPRLSANRTGQTDLPATIAVADLAATGIRVYAELVPA